MKLKFYIKELRLPVGSRNPDFTASLEAELQRAIRREHPGSFADRTPPVAAIARSMVQEIRGRSNEFSR